MSLELDQRLQGAGTRFLLFLQPRFLTEPDGSPVSPTPPPTRSGAGGGAVTDL